MRYKIKVRIAGRAARWHIFISPRPSRLLRQPYWRTARGSANETEVLLRVTHPDYGANLQIDCPLHPLIWRRYGRLSRDVGSVFRFVPFLPGPFHLCGFGIALARFLAEFSSERQLPRVFPSQKNTTFPRMRTNILTFPQSEKTWAGQPRTGR
jgi:hypothetical protein